MPKSIKDEFKELFTVHKEFTVQGGEFIDRNGKKLFGSDFNIIGLNTTGRLARIWSVVNNNGERTWNQFTIPDFHEAHLPIALIYLSNTTPVQIKHIQDNTYQMLVPNTHPFTFQLHSSNPIPASTRIQAQFITTLQRMHRLLE
jgi:hypothetical protein